MKRASFVAPLPHRIRVGFTLVELLVVIAIIGVLVALLLPAVQMAREAARRSQCQNNVKQIGLAMHNFHDTYGVFPPGSDRIVTGPTNADARWMAGWATFILPYMEQQTVYDKLNPITKFYNPSSSVNTLPNVVVLNGFTAKFYICPSSPLPKLIQPEDSTGGLINIQAGNYVGIMGATTNALSATDPSGDNRVCDCSSSLAPNQVHHGGYLASNGVIVPGLRIRMASITDGTSNTIMVGEQSDWGEVPPGVGTSPPVPKSDMRATRRAGLWANLGVSRASYVPVAGASCSGNEGGSTVTVRHQIGTKKRNSHQDGMGRYAWNTPIQSAHPGGAMMLRCDGSVHFELNSIDRPVLNWLCIRDDGKN